VPVLGVDSVVSPSGRYNRCACADSVAPREEATDADVIRGDQHWQVALAVRDLDQAMTTSYRGAIPRHYNARNDELAFSRSTAHR